MAHIIIYRSFYDVNVGNFAFRFMKLEYLDQGSFCVKKTLDAKADFRSVVYRGGVRVVLQPRASTLN